MLFECMFLVCFEICFWYVLQVNFTYRIDFNLNGSDKFAVVVKMQTNADWHVRITSMDSD